MSDTEQDTAPVLNAADVLALNPTDTAEAVPLVGNRRQLDILGRQLLAHRKGLEAARMIIDAQLVQMIDQLDAMFSVLAGLQTSADLAIAAATLETPEPEPRRPPSTFGGKHRDIPRTGTNSPTGGTDG